MFYRSLVALIRVARRPAAGPRDRRTYRSVRVSILHGPANAGFFCGRSRSAKSSRRGIRECAISIHAWSRLSSNRTIMSSWRRRAESSRESGAGRGARIAIGVCERRPRSVVRRWTPRRGNHVIGGLLVAIPAFVVLGGMLKGRITWSRRFARPPVINGEAE